MDGDHRITVVIRPGEHRTEFERFEVAFSLRDRDTQLFLGRGIFRLFGEFQQNRKVVGLSHKGFERLQNIVDRLEFGNDGLGLILIVPEVGCGHGLVQLTATGFFVAQVKESLEVG